LGSRKTLDSHNFIWVEKRRMKKWISGVGQNEKKYAKGRELKKGDSEEPPWT
jgi:hypothetical protein